MLWITIRSSVGACIIHYTHHLRSWAFLCHEESWLTLWVFRCHQEVWNFHVFLQRMWNSICHHGVWNLIYVCHQESTSSAICYRGMWISRYVIKRPCGCCSWRCLGGSWFSRGQFCQFLSVFFLGFISSIIQRKLWLCTCRQMFVLKYIQLDLFQCLII